MTRWLLLFTFAILSLLTFIVFITPEHTCRLDKTTSLSKGSVNNLQKAFGRNTIAFSDEQVRRQKLLAEFCRRTKNVAKIFALRNVQPGHVPDIYLNHKVKTVYCGIPKVASTNWKRVLLRLSGASHVNRLAKDLVHVVPIARFFNSLSSRDIYRVMRYYYSFLFVRHPFERLVSSYRNKFQSRNSYFNELYGTEILRLYRPNATLQERAEGSGVTFFEFVRWIIEKRKFDAHWAPYEPICHYCTLPYDFIGKFETLQEDAKQVLDHLGVGEWTSFPANFTDGYAVSSRHLAREYFSKLPNETVDRLYGLYLQDFLAFGYNKTL